MPSPPAHVAETPERVIAPALSWFRLPTAPGAVCLMLVGELDLVNAERAREAVHHAQDETRELICDLGDVWFVDLPGLRVLLDAAAQARLTGGRLVVTNCPPIVSRLLRLLRLEGALEIQPTPPSVVPAPRSSAIRRRLG